MKKKLFTLLMLISAFVCGASAQSYHQISGTEQVSCSQNNIEASDWITYSAAKYAERKKCVTSGEIIPNLSSGDRVVVFYVTGCESFDVSVDGNGTRKLNIKVNDVLVEEEVWAANCSTHEGLKTNTTGECKITIAGVDGSVYLSSVIFNAPSGPSSDATIKSLTVAGNVVEPVESANSYELPASFDGTTAEVVITPNDAKSVVTVSSDAAPNTEAGAYTTNVTIGTPVTITVTPETGAEDALTYTLSVTKAANLSSDTSLKSVTVDDVELPADDDGNYTLDIAFAYDKPLNIVVAANDDMADAVIDQNKPTVEGGASVDVKITVTAEDQSTKDYTLKITRAAASVECELTTFSINGFIGTIDEDAKTIGIKVIKDYDFSHTPVMTVSENATAVWNKDAKSVVVTAQDGTTNATYTVNVAAESVEALSVFPTNLSFAAATYTEPVEWIYGASYNAGLKDAADENVVGGYELKKESDNVGIEAGSNVLNIYLEKCATLTVNVGATGGRYVVATVGDTECGNATLTKGVASDLVCTVDKREPVTVVIRSYKNDKKEAATGGTRIYSVNVTAPTDQPDNISNQSVENAMTVYSVDGIVYVSVAKAQVANIYSIDGRLVKVVELNEGDNTISGLSNGIYLINNKKVVIK